MPKQAIIYFKNGGKDWIDPVDEDCIQYIDGTIFINNGYSSYEYPEELIDKIELVDI